MPLTIPALAEAGKLAAFLLFLALGAWVSRARGARRSRAVRAFAGTTLVLCLFAGTTQIDVWPFTSNTLAVGRVRGDPNLSFLVLRGVDAEGREWDLDPQTWTPVFESILKNWLASRYPRLSASDRREAERFLVARANETRLRLRAGKRIGFERLLGPLACGYWWRLPRVAKMPDTEFRSIRVYRLEYRLGEIARYGRIVRESPVLELRG